MVRIIILCGEFLTVFQQAVLDRILSDSRIVASAALIDSRPGLSFMKRFKKNLKRGRGGYMLIMFFNHFRKKKETVVAAKYFLSRVGIPCIDTKHPYIQETIDTLACYSADLMVLIGGFASIKQYCLG